MTAKTKLFAWVLLIALAAAFPAVPGCSRELDRPGNADAGTERTPENIAPENADEKGAGGVSLPARQETETAGERSLRQQPAPLAGPLGDSTNITRSTDRNVGEIGKQIDAFCRSLEPSIHEPAVGRWRQRERGFRGNGEETLRHQPGTNLIEFELVEREC